IRQRSDAGKTTRQYRTELSLDGGRLRYESLPIPIDDVHARVILTENRAEILELTGRCGLSAPASRSATNPAVPPTVRLSGTLDFGAATPTGGFQVQADAIPLSDPSVLGALPERIRSAWQRTRIRGTATIQLDRLLLAPGDDGRPLWDANGSIALRDAGMDVGMRFDGATGTMTGSAKLIDGAPAELHLDSRFNAIRAEGLPLENVNGRMELTADRGMLRIDELTGHAFGGTLAGFAQIDLSAV